MNIKVFCTAAAAAAVFAAQCTGAYAESFSQTLENFVTVPETMIEYKNPKENFEQRYNLVPREMKVVMPFEVKGETQFFVSPDGNDFGKGTIDDPLKTVKAALKRIENLDYTVRSRGVVLYLRGGEYPIHECIELNGKHSGLDDAPLYISAYNKEEVTFSVADAIPLSSFVPVSDESIRSRLYPNARDHVLEVSLPEMGITDYGSINYNDEYNKKYPALETKLYMDNEPMTLARYPNSGMLRLGELVEWGPTSAAEDVGQGFEWTMADDVPLKWQYKDDIGVYAYFSYNYDPEKSV